MAVVSESGLPIRILIVDRHEAVRRALRIRLSVPSHLDVVGDSATLSSVDEKIRCWHPDVIVLGLHNATDEELAVLVRSVASICSKMVTVIVLAPYIDAMERDLILGAGAKRYLLKHINSNQLIHEIESAVAWHASI